MKINSFKIILALVLFLAFNLHLKSQDSIVDFSKYKNDISVEYSPVLIGARLNYRHSIFLSKKKPFMFTLGVGVAFDADLKGFILPVFAELGYGTKNRFYLSFGVNSIFNSSPILKTNQEINAYLKEKEFESYASHDEKPTLPYDVELNIGIGYRRDFGRVFVYSGLYLHFERIPAFDSNKKWQHRLYALSPNLGVGLNFGKGNGKD